MPTDANALELVHQAVSGSRAGWASSGYRRKKIPIHAPRGGSDLGLLDTLGGSLISIHAPRGGSDSKDAQFSGRIFGEGIKVCLARPRKSYAKPV